MRDDTNTVISNGQNNTMLESKRWFVMWGSKPVTHAESPTSPKSPMSPGQWMMLSRQLYSSQTASPRLLLFCFVYAGGNVNVFRDWTKYAAPGVDIIAVSLPGHGSRTKEPLIRDFKQLVVAAVDAFVQVFSERVFVPIDVGSAKCQYAFFGHSFGATLAFEMIREIQERKSKGILHDGRFRYEIPVMLFAGARRAPHWPFEIRPGEQRVIDKSRQEMWELVKKHGGTPDEVLNCKELFDIVLPSIQLDWSMAQEFIAFGTKERPLRIECPIVYYQGERDVIPEESQHAWGELAPENSPSSSPAFEFVKVPGNHFFIHPDQCVAQVVEGVMQRLSSQFLGQ